MTNSEIKLQELGLQRLKWTSRGMRYSPDGAYIKITSSKSMRDTPKTLEMILMEVCEKLNIRIDEILSDSRLRHLVDARQIFFRIAREKTGYNLKRIGLAVNRDHSSVIHGLKKAKEVKELIDLYDMVSGVIPSKKDDLISVVEMIKEEEKETVVSPFRNITPANNKEYSGYREHSL